MAQRGRPIIHPPQKVRAAAYAVKFFPELSQQAVSKVVGIDHSHITAERKKMDLPLRPKGGGFATSKMKKEKKAKLGTIIRPRGRPKGIPVNPKTLEMVHEAMYWREKGLGLKEIAQKIGKYTKSGKTTKQFVSLLLKDPLYEGYRDLDLPRRLNKQ